MATKCKHFSVERRSLAPGLPQTNLNICKLKDEDLAIRNQLHAIQFKKGITGSTPGPSCPPRCWKDGEWELCPMYLAT